MKNINNPPITRRDKNTDPNVLAASLAQIATLVPKPNGTDDTTTIQSIINDVSTSGGGNILFPDGTYLIDADGTGNQYAGVALKSNVTIILSPQTIIKAITNSSTNYAIFNIINQSNVRIEGQGTIQGDRSTHTGSTGEWGMGVYISQSSDVRIKDITIKDCWGDGVYVGGGNGAGTESVNIRIKNVTIDNCRRQGVSFTHVLNGWIDKCTITNINGTAPKAGVDIEPNANQHVKKVKITDSVFMNNDVGIQLFGTAGLELSDITITGNSCDTHVLHGIYISYATDVKASKNTCINSTQYGFLIENSSGILVEGNTSNNNQYGFYARNSSFELDIINNKAKNNTGNGFFLNGVSFSSLCNNKAFYNGTHGVYAYSSNDNEISDNRCVGNGTSTDVTYDNININADSTNVNGDNNNIQGNICRVGSGQTNRPRYGININASYCDNNLVANNDLYNSGITGDLNDSGTGTRTKPTASECKYHQATTQNLTAGTSTIIKYDVQDYDTRSEYNTSNGGFFPKSSGIFVVTAGVMWSAGQTAGNVTQLAIYKNGSFDTRLCYSASGAVGTSLSQGTATVKLAKGDWIDIRAVTSNALSTATDQFGTFLKIMQLT